MRPANLTGNQPLLGPAPRVSAPLAGPVDPGICQTPPHPGGLADPRNGTISIPWVSEILQRPTLADLSAEPMAQFFTHHHLPGHLAEVSAPFCRLAEHVIATLARNPERTVTLRKLLEAKDSAVRSAIYDASTV